MHVMGTVSVLVFAIATLLILLLGKIFGKPPWNTIGLVLWLPVVSIVVSWAMINMGAAGKAAFWELPLFVAGLCLFVVASNQSLEGLKSPKPRRS